MGPQQPSLAFLRPFCNTGGQGQVTTGDQESMTFQDSYLRYVCVCV